MRLEPISAVLRDMGFTTTPYTVGLLDTLQSLQDLTFGVIAVACYFVWWLSW